MPTVVDFRLSLPDAESREDRDWQRSVLARTVHLLQHVFEQSTAEDLKAIEAVLERVAEAPPVPEQKRPLVERLTGGREYSLSERIALEAANLQRSFDLRRQVLADSLTAPGVAKLLGTTRQTPYDRARKGTLLAVMDRGVLRFPCWQFDPAGPGGVIDGLPEVLQALPVSALAKASWLTKPSPYFEGRTPLETLKAGEKERVLDAARAVGAL